MVRPLIEQVNVREQAIGKLKEEVKSLKKNLRILHAVARTPKLIDMYHKEERKLF